MDVVVDFEGEEGRCNVDEVAPLRSAPDNGGIVASGHELSAFWLLSPQTYLQRMGITVPECVLNSDRCLSGDRGSC
jgi:hypothetical protein